MFIARLFTMLGVVIEPNTLSGIAAIISAFLSPLAMVLVSIFGRAKPKDEKQKGFVWSRKTKVTSVESELPNSEDAETLVDNTSRRKGWYVYLKPVAPILYLASLVFIFIYIQSFSPPIILSGQRHFDFNNVNKSSISYSSKEEGQIERMTKVAANGAERIFETDAMTYHEGNFVASDGSLPYLGVKFTRKPKLVLSVNFADSSSPSSRYDVSVEDVQNDTFKIRVRVWGDSQLNGIRVQWIAVGK